MLTARHFARLVALTAGIFLSSCSDHLPPMSLDARLNYDPDFFGRDLDLVISNHGNAPICFSATDLDPLAGQLQLQQNGRAVEQSRYANRAPVKLNGVDISSGIAVVPPGDRHFSINFNDFEMKAGSFTASMILDAFDCVDFFKKGRPLQRLKLTTKVEGVLSRRAAETIVE